MRLIFMGTPDFAVPTLKTLTESSHEVVAVYTQPDREAGRGKRIIYSPVKEFALEKNIPVFQPEKLRGEEEYERMRTLNADAIIVVAYGQILKKPVLNMTRYGCFNVHASLLPKYRGAAPIQWAILNGEKTTGVTIMQMDEGLDTGDILNKTEITIAPNETGDSLFEKLSVLGGAMLLETLEQAQIGMLRPVKQGETTTMYAKMLDKKIGHLDFTKPAEEVDRWVRGLNSWPSAYTYLNGKMLKIWGVQVTEDSSETEPGTVCAVTKKNFTIRCGAGAIIVTELQPEGKKRMSTDAFLRGYEVKVNDRFE